LGRKRAEISDPLILGIEYRESAILVDREPRESLRDRCGVRVDRVRERQSERERERESERERERERDKVRRTDEPVRAFDSPTIEPRERKSTTRVCKEERRETTRIRFLVRSILAYTCNCAPGRHRRRRGSSRDAPAVSSIALEGRRRTTSAVECYAATWRRRHFVVTSTVRFFRHQRRRRAYSSPRRDP
jgi:hypothetical protein